MSLLTKIFGDANARHIRDLQEVVVKVNARETHYQDLNDEELRNVSPELRAGLEHGDKSLDDLLPDAFAACREAAHRALNQRHFDVQVLAGLALHQGQITEMRTGEGKTLTATLPLYLNALAGKGVHLVTVNDYLSKRDCGWMGPVFSALGMSVGVIVHDAAFRFDLDFVQEGATDPRLKHLRPVSRKDAYLCDITYGTNNEFGFDYLRDNMVQDLSQMVQRELFYAIVDEVDSILIDEARTPLIISAPDVESTDKYYQFAKLVVRLEENTDYNIDEKMRAATLTESGIGKLENWLGVDNIYTDRGISEVHHIEQALRAHTLYHRDRDYVVRDGEVVIIDEFTGRMLPGRRYSEGLHQAIEAKEGVQVQRESKTLATITFQNYFRLFKKLAGMTGTAATEAEEFSKIYKLDVTVVPTNRDMIRADASDRIYKTEEAKFQAVVEEVKQRNSQGQPVLIGTISISKSERLADLLRRNGIEPAVLNAKFHEREAAIIAEAGHRNAVTVATNMAGRGVDIKLGGEEAAPEQEQEIKAHGGLHIIGTERHESRRIDNQLRGRSGRQGDPGSSQFYVSLEDDLMRIFGSDRIKGVMERLKIPDDVPIENRLVTKALDAAQKKVEGFHFDTRKHLVEYDDVLNKQREAIYRKRREILSAEVPKDAVLDMVEDEITDVVAQHTQGDDEHAWDIEEVYEVVHTIFPVGPEERQKLADIQSMAGDDNQDKDARKRLTGYLYKKAVEAYNRQEESLTKATGNVTAMRQVERGIVLRSIDTLWIEHLEALDHLRTGIGLRGYGQRDPLVEYQREAFGLFKHLLSFIRKQVVYSIYKVGFATQLAPSEMQRMAQQATFTAPAKEQTSKQSGIVQEASQIRGEASMAKEVASREAQAPMKENTQTHYQGQKVGRNDPCPCGATNPDGSPKKFKNCHGK